MTPQSCTEKLARFVVETDEVPPAVLSGLAHALVDTLGSAIAGANEECAAIARRVTQTGPADGVTVWGRMERASPADAAFINGIAGHALDFDDTLASLRGHSSVTTIPVALAIGEQIHASGKEVLTALALGLEVAGKLGSSLGHGHYLRGWHSTATVGAFAAAAVASRLLRQDTSSLRRAWGIAAAQAGGLVRNFGTMAKPFQAGHAARAGLVSAQLATAGMTGDLRILDAPNGFLETYGANGQELGESLEELGRRWEVIDPGLNVKRWPCCYCCHRAIGGLVEMLAELGIERGDVLAVTVGFPPGSDEPLIYTEPRTGLEAKFSIEYPIAALLLDGSLTLPSFSDEMVQRPQVRALMQHVKRVAVPDIGTFSGTVGYTDLEIATKHGSWSRRISRAPGSREWPVSPAERREKFLGCVATLFAPVQAEELLSMAERCIEMADIGQLARRMAPGPDPSTTGKGGDAASVSAGLPSTPRAC